MRKAHKPEQHAPAFIFWLIVGAVIVVSGLMVWPFVPALLWAGVFSILLWPLRNRIIARGGRPLWAAVLPTALVAGLIFLPTLLIGVYVGAEAYGFMNQLRTTSAANGNNDLADEAIVQVDQATTPILRRLGVESFSVYDYYSENKQDLFRRFEGPLVRASRRFVEDIVLLVLALITMFFFLLEGEKLLDPVCDLVPLAKEKTMDVLQHMAATVRSVFLGVVLVALIQAILAGIGYAIAGVHAPLLWAVGTFVLCLIPLIGAPFAYFPLAAMLLYQGHTWQGVFLAAWGLLLVSTIDHILRPIFIGSRIKLHPMAVAFALLGGSLVFGPVGLMAGPMILSLLLGIIEILRTRRLDGEAAPEPAT